MIFGAEEEHAVCGYRWHRHKGDRRIWHTCSDGAGHGMEHRCNCGAVYPS